MAETVHDAARGASAGGVVRSAATLFLNHIPFRHYAFFCQHKIGHAISFKPSKAYLYQSTSVIKESTSLAQFDAAKGNAWFFEGGSNNFLHLKFYMTRRPGVTGAGPEQTGKEIVLHVEH